MLGEHDERILSKLLNLDFRPAQLAPISFNCFLYFLLLFLLRDLRFFLLLFLGFTTASMAVSLAGLDLVKVESVGFGKLALKN